MGSTRRRFTDEYKLEAVSFVIDGGRSVAEVARNIGALQFWAGNDLGAAVAARAVRVQWNRTRRCWLAMLRNPCQRQLNVDPLVAIES